MKRTLITAISGLFLLLLLGGCASDAASDKPGLSRNEQDLLSIQDEVNIQIEKLNNELKNSPLNYDAVVSLASESSKLITDSITKVEELAEELGNSKIVTDTKKVLNSAQMLVNKVKELAADLKTLQNDLSQLAGDAKKEIEDKIAEAGKLLDGYKLRLAGIKDRFEELRSYLFGEETAGETPSAAEKAVESKKSEATI